MLTHQVVLFDYTHAEHGLDVPILEAVLSTVRPKDASPLSSYKVGMLACAYSCRLFRVADKRLLLRSSILPCCTAMWIMPRGFWRSSKDTRKHGNLPPPPPPPPYLPSIVCLLASPLAHLLLTSVSGRCRGCRRTAAPSRPPCTGPSARTRQNLSASSSQRSFPSLLGSQVVLLLAVTLSFPFWLHCYSQRRP
jgi:hypothetical protein